MDLLDIESRRINAVLMVVELCGMEFIRKHRDYSIIYLMMMHS